MASTRDFSSLTDVELHRHATRAREAIRSGYAELEELMFELGKREANREHIRQLSAERKRRRAERSE